MKSLLIVLLILGVWLVVCSDGQCFRDLAWEKISQEIVEVNTVWVDSQDSRVILIGTNRGVFITEDGGNSWQAVLFGTNKIVNFLYVDQLNKNLIYAGCSSGLFFSGNQGEAWRRIYQGKTEQEANCLSLIKLNDKEIYLGTEAGLFSSQNSGRSWHKFPGRLGNLVIRAIAADQVNKAIYVACSEGVYLIKPQARAKRIFISHPVDLEATDREPENAQFIEESDYQINHICVDHSKPQDIYLATTRGVFKSKDQGATWEKFSGFGLLSRNVRFITILAGPLIGAVTKSGVFVYGQDRWHELSLRLPVQDIRFLISDQQRNIYVAGDKGLFRSSQYSRSIYASTANTPRLTVRQVQQAAIKYAQVVDPERIATHRRLARFKAILPDLDLDYDKTISSYNNSTLTRFTVGPPDWGISLKWNLSDLIWSEQQRIIDSQVRLMVKLRQDILDEVTRLYFARRRLELELLSSEKFQTKEKQNKELKIQELTALLDGLTGGYFSKMSPN